MKSATPAQRNRLSVCTVNQYTAEIYMRAKQMEVSWLSIPPIYRFNLPMKILQNG